MKIEKLFRAIGAKEVKLDKEARTIEFPFSSEYPVERWFGKEILSHDQKAIDLGRLQDGGVLLWNHNPDIVIGSVTAELRSDKRLWASARFSQNEKAQEVMRDVEDDILKNVSFGYQISEMTLTKSDKQNGDEYTATKWMPFEVSIVSIPADPTVGIGRSQNEEKTEVRILNPLKGENRVTPEEIKKQEEERKLVEAKVRDEAVKAERERMQAINALGAQFKKPELARQLVEGGKSIEEARQAFLTELGQKQVPLTGKEGEIGLTEKEKRSFSFLRMLAAMANPQDRKLQELAAFERECSEAAQKQTGKTARGYMIPVDVLRAGFQRDLNVGTSTQGGHLVATDLLSGSFIDMLRNASILDRAGATVMNGLVGNIAIPRQTGGATAYWVAESGAPTESTQALDQVTMSPKTLGAYTDYSRKLLLQSSIDVEAFIRKDLAKVIALEIDRVGLYGSGSSNQPLGVKDTTNVNTKDFAADAPTYAEIVAMETEVAADNADVGALKYLVNARGRGVLKGVDKASGAAQFVWEPGNMINGYQALVSNQVSLVSSGKEHYWFGNWADLLIGYWSGLDVLVDPYTNSTTGIVRIVAMQDCDVAVRHPESFCLGANLT